MKKSAGVLESLYLGDTSQNSPDVDEVRASMYGILGRLYSQELTSEFTKELSRAGFLTLLAGVAPGLAVEKTLDFESLEVEFARLFVGPGPHSPPYASVYRKDDQRPGQLWGSTTGEVKRFMAHYGLELDQQGAIPDHVSVLFEFMERLLRAKIDALGRGDDKACRQADRIQRRFFRDYIETWIDRFLAQVQEANPPPFYEAVTKLTGRFVMQERMFFSGTLDKAASGNSATSS